MLCILLVILSLVGIVLASGSGDCCGYGSSGSQEGDSKGPDISKPPFTCNGPFSIKNDSDVENIAQCPTYDGDIDIDSNFKGPLQLGSTLSEINGDLTCSGASGLTSISAETLSAVGGDIIMQDLTLLSSMEISNIIKIDGSMNLQNLPSLTTLSFRRLSMVGGGLNVQNIPKLKTTDIGTALNSATSIHISNTSLTSLTLKRLKYLKNFDVIGNELMGTISVDTLYSIEDSIYLGNLPSLLSADFPALNNIHGGFKIEKIQNQKDLGLPLLKTANTIEVFSTGLTELPLTGLTQIVSLNITGNELLDVIDLQSLNTSTGEFQIKGNGHNLAIDLQDLLIAESLNLEGFNKVNLSSLSFVNTKLIIESAEAYSLQLPSITTIGGDLVISRSSQLQDLSLPLLNSIEGSLLISDNLALKHLDGFPALRQVGSLDIQGNFSSLSFPSLAEVNSSVNIATSSTNTSICRYINTLSRDGVIRADATCTPQPGLAKHDIIGVIVGAAMGVLFVVRSGLHLWMIRRRHQQEADGVGSDAGSLASRSAR